MLRSSSGKCSNTAPIVLHSEYKCIAQTGVSSRSSFFVTVSLLNVLLLLKFYLALPRFIYLSQGSAALAFVILKLVAIHVIRLSISIVFRNFIFLLGACLSLITCSYTQSLSRIPAIRLLMSFSPYSQRPSSVSTCPVPFQMRVSPPPISRVCTPCFTPNIRYSRPVFHLQYPT